jgi:hypothetical protein
MTGKAVKMFDISPSYTVPGDVNIETGNIVFSGDVIVYGNVMDHMTIESLGNVYIYGSVYNAAVTAIGSIYVRGNVIGSKLYSGSFGIMFNRLHLTSRTLAEQAANLLDAGRTLVQALESRKQPERIGRVVLLLIEKKYKDFPAVVKELLAVLANIRHMKNEEHRKLQDMCAVFLQRHKIVEAADLEFLHRFLSLLEETHQETARMLETKAEVKLNQCHNSVIKSNGDIIIMRDGVILSHLNAGRNIRFKRDSAVCRGSTLEAGGSIVAQIVGGLTSLNTLLKAKVNVTVRKMYAGRICVGKRCIEIDKVIEEATFNNNDELKMPACNRCHTS